MKMITIRTKRIHHCAVVPKYAHTGEYGDLAADLCSVEELVFQRGDIKTIPIGIALELPLGYGAIIADRSGLAVKGFTTFGGVIDPGYRGELRVVASYFGEEPLTINIGDRVAQLRIVRRIDATFVEVEELGSTGRSQRGFGSTGR
jgi:dUTP pyrophosphatase